MRSGVKFPVHNWHCVGLPFGQQKQKDRTKRLETNNTTFLSGCLVCRKHLLAHRSKAKIWSWWRQRYSWFVSLQPQGRKISQDANLAASKSKVMEVRLDTKLHPLCSIAVQKTFWSKPTDKRHYLDSEQKGRKLHFGSCPKNDCSVFLLVGHNFVVSPNMSSAALTDSKRLNCCTQPSFTQGAGKLHCKSTSQLLTDRWSATEMYFWQSRSTQNWPWTEILEPSGLLAKKIYRIRVSWVHKLQSLFWGARWKKNCDKPQRLQICLKHFSFNWNLNCTEELEHAQLLPTSETIHNCVTNTFPRTTVPCGQKCDCSLEASFCFWNKKRSFRNTTLGKQFSTVWATVHLQSLYG